MSLSDAFHVSAGAAAVLPEFQQLGDLGHAETQIARTAYETQRVHFLVAVAPVTRVGARHRRQQAERLVVPHHLGLDARTRSGFTDVECLGTIHRGAPFQRRSSSALPTTLTLLKAIAAPAITGFSKPKAANGMPTTL